MKKTILIFRTALIALSFLLLNSCNDELNLVEFGEEKPVIYGFISMADSATYVRVERSFVDTKRGAPEIALIPDSLYYSTATVTLVKVKTNERFVMQKVDGNKEGYPRAEGPFAKSPNWLYKFKNLNLDLKPDEFFRIEVQKAGAKEPFAVATTKVVGTYEVITPAPNIAMFIDGDKTFTIGVSTEEKTARLFAVRVVVNYDDVNATSGIRTPKQITWNVIPSESRKAIPLGYEEIYFRTPSKEFFQFLGREIPLVTGVTRSFKNLEIEMDAGGQEFVDALNVGIANLGITGSQTIPTYSNVTNPKGDVVVGYGVFSSRNRFVKKGILLNDQSLEYLKNGEFTKNLNFR